MEAIFQNINSLKIFTILLIVVLFISFLFTTGKLKNNNKFQLLIYAFFLILLHSVFISSNQSESLMASLHALLIMIFIALLGSLFSYKKIIFYLNILFIFITGVILFSSDMLLLFTGKSYFYEGNFFGILGNANYLGAVIAIFLLPYFLTQKPRKNKYKYIQYFTIANLVYILFLTRSRAALGVFIVLLGYLYLRNINYKNVKYYVLFTIILIPVLYVIYDTFLVNIIFKYKSQSSVIGTREILWLTRIEAISQKPVWGWGFAVNNFTYLDSMHHFNKLEKGNTILAILEELGIIMGGLFILLLNYLFVFILRKETFLFFKLVVLATMLHLIFETWLFNFNGLMAVIFWLIVYLSLSSQKRFISK
jgi:hypothetical protein